MPNGSVRIATIADRAYHKKRDANERDNRKFFEQLEAQILNGAVDQARAVIGRNNLDTVWQARFQFGKFDTHTLDNLAGILALAHNDNASGDLPFAVQLGNSAPHVGANWDSRHVADGDGNAACSASHRNRTKIIERLKIACRARNILGLGQFDHGPAGFLIGARERRAHVRRAHAVRGELLRIDYDLILPDHPADAGNFGDAGHGLQSKAQEPVLDAAELCEVMTPFPVDQCILLNPAHARCVPTK